VLQILLAFLLLILAPIWLYNVGEKEQAEFVLHVITAIGVFSAVMTAVYGDRIKRRFNRITLRIEKPDQSDNFVNFLVPSDPKTAVFCHHLRVTNSTPTEPVKNCRVWLVKILDEDGRGGFEEKFKFAVPRLMAWAPREYSPDVRSFSENQVFDFGRSFVRQDGRFEIGVYELQGGTFRGDCLPEQTRQYVFKITADNYIEARPIIVEVHVGRCDPTPDWPYDTRTRVDVKPGWRRLMVL
jgi:hypothetical protein